jgi:hypothetical protein
VRVVKNRLSRKSPAAIGKGLRRIFRWRSSAKLTRLVMSVAVAGSWLGKRDAVMSSVEWEIVVMQAGEEEDGEVQIPGVGISRVKGMGEGKGKGKLDRANRRIRSGLRC